MLIHAWLFNSPSSIALYSSMKSSTSSMKEKLKDSQQQILTKTPKKGYSESITCPVSAAPHRCEKINPNLRTLRSLLDPQVRICCKTYDRVKSFSDIYSLSLLAFPKSPRPSVYLSRWTSVCLLSCLYIFSAVRSCRAAAGHPSTPKQSNKEARSPSSKQTFSWVWQGGIYCSCLFL